MVMMKTAGKFEKENVMRKQKIFASVAAALFLVAGASVVNAGKISVELGKEMFNDPKLAGSANDSSCNSCHAGGKGLENVVSKKLSKSINNCLVGKMEGTKLDGRQAPMRSLKKYVLSLHE